MLSYHADDVMYKIKDFVKGEGVICNEWLFQRHRGIAYWIDFKFRMCDQN